VLPGIGHGVQSWMQQMGVRPTSPLATLEEVLVAVRRLLDGDRVTMHGRHVHLDDVQLAQPPDDPPPLLAGVRGPRSLAMAGRSAGGVVLAEPASPSYVRWALEHCGHPGDFHVAVFSVLCVAADRNRAYETMAPWLATLLADPHVGLRALPFFDDLVTRFNSHGVGGLAAMPSEWWTEIGPIGTVEDAVTHIEALEAAGVHSIGLFPAPDVSIAAAQLDDVLRLGTR
jgi:alkanesulfonate monooxygenase SsuD/methylene tetrahydromethanopterin reductase-like flavin-dependent oxidoreductase (luciferase family)